MPHFEVIDQVIQCALRCSSDLEIFYSIYGPAALHILELSWHELISLDYRMVIETKSAIPSQK